MSGGESLTIVQVSRMDVGGGGHKVPLRLHREYLKMGHRSYLVVGQKFTETLGVVPMERRTWVNCGLVGCAKVACEKLFGWQYLAHPGSHRIPDLIPDPVDVFHLHNLHGGYFDLAALPGLSRAAPTGLTLHDLWLRSGHCAYDLGCDRWRAGCGRCPDLTLYPAVPADGTRVNLWRKRYYLRRSRVWITAPSRWILEEVEDSYLREIPRRLIYNGVDVEAFKVGSKENARASLGLPKERRIILFLATRGLDNPYKDGPTLMSAVRLLIEESPPSQRPFFVSIGGGTQLASLADPANYVSVPFTDDEELLATYYRASDVLANASRADNCPLTVLEAMASEVPTVASAVGGIPELVVEGDTGFLVQVGDVRGMCDALRRITSDRNLARAMGMKARARAVSQFSLATQAAATVDWYREIRTEWQSRERRERLPAR